VVGQLYNTQIRVVETQRKLDYQNDLEEQLADLRDRLQEVRRIRESTCGE
jgi:hypothetical protein